MADTLSIKDEDLRKKDDFGNRLVAELDKMKKKLNAANSKIQHILATPPKLRKTHNRSRHIFDPSNETETKAQESDMV